MEEVKNDGADGSKDNKRLIMYCRRGKKVVLGVPSDRGGTTMPQRGTQRHTDWCFYTVFRSKLDFYADILLRDTTMVARKMAMFTLTTLMSLILTLAGG